MKNLKKAIITLMTVLLIFTSVGITAFADNHEDSPFNFKLPSADRYTVLNEGRKKTNDSSSYISSDSVNPSEGALFSIHGYSKDKYTNISNLENCTLGNSSARIWPGQKRRIRQYVYEWGYTYAFLGGSAISSAGANKSLTGMWSPDSVGNDPYCN